MAHDEVPLDDVLDHTGVREGHERTVALKGIALTHPRDMATVLDLLRRGALHPDATPDEVRGEPLPATRGETEVEIAYVRAILEGAFAAQYEARLIVAYRARLVALQRHVGRTVVE
jgi:hypothetical protein